MRGQALVIQSDKACALPILHTPAELHCRARGLILLAAPEWGRLPSLVAQQALVLLWALQRAQPHKSASNLHT